MIDSKVILYWRFFLFSIAVSTLFIPFYILSKIYTPWCWKFGSFYLNSWNYMMGHRIIVRGEKSRDKPTLFCANHISYVDITTVGPVINGRFIAKAEVKDWPLFGYLATLKGTIYVDRTKAGTTEGLRQLNEAIKNKDNLILFPEGTTTDGCRVLPFRSSYFDIAMKNNLTVQPITISYAGWDGMPMPHYMKKIVGWFSVDMDMFPHLKRIIQMGKIHAVVTFHPPLKANDFKSRKELAHKCWEDVNLGLAKTYSTPLFDKAA